MTSARPLPLRSLQRLQHTVARRLARRLARGLVRWCMCIAPLLLASARTAVAQGPNDITRQPGATRAALEAFVRQQAARVDTTTDARVTAVKHRLQHGDFTDGEQVVLLVAGQPTLSDTFTVQPGLLLSLPGIAPASLGGLLRAELQPYLHQHIGRFVRDAQVSALTLVRIGVLGAVRNPGFYRVATETPLSELLMAAGGPTSEADLARVSIRRANAPPAAKPSVAAVLTQALDDLAMQTGDQVIVEAVKKKNWSGISQATTLLVGMAVAIASLTR